MTDNKTYRTVPTNPFDQLPLPVKAWGTGPLTVAAARIDTWDFDGVELMVDWNNRLLAFRYPSHVDVYNMDDREDRWMVNLKETRP